MRILLLNPNHSTRENLSVDPVLTRCVGIPAKAPYLWPPIGLACLAGHLRQRFDVELLDAQAEGLSREQVLERIDHDLVFVNAGTPTIGQDLSLTRDIKNMGPRTALIGTHATYFHRDLIKSPGVDFIVCGEPEKPSLNLAISLDSGRPPSQVRGLAWKRSGRPVKNPSDSPLQNLDELPFAARDLLPSQKYYDILTKKSPIAFAITSRGCPFSCRFCSAGFYGGKAFRARSAGNVLAEVREMQEQGFRDISFFDDTFTIDRRRVLDICQGLGELGLPWRCLSRTDTVDMEMLRQMRESGCYQIFFGVESGDQNMLDMMCKGASPEQTRQAFSWCDELGIETVGSFVLGYPGETHESIKRTISFARELRPDFVSFNLFTPIPGSEIFEELKRQDEWEQYNFITTSFCDIPSEEMVKAIGEAYRGYYMKPSYLIRRMRKTGEPLRIAKQNISFWTKRSGVLWRFIRKAT
jgi:anaerobic magnesium-protoporphyrin IX monomethyl ester cyclase